MNKTSTGITLLVVTALLSIGIKACRIYHRHHKENILGIETPEPKCYRFVDLGLPVQWLDMAIDINAITYAEAEKSHGNRLPTQEEAQALIDVCNWEYRSEFHNGGPGGAVGTSKKNNEVIKIIGPDFWIKSNDESSDSALVFVMNEGDSIPHMVARKKDEKALVNTVSRDTIPFPIQ